MKAYNTGLDTDTRIGDAEKRVMRCIGYLPHGLASEIINLCRGRLGGLSDVREIRVRLGGRCSLNIKGEYIPLLGTPSAEDMDEILMKLCDGSLYAYRDNISSGYIPLGDGIRVGVCGMARYEGLGVVGISETSGFVFRIPGVGCAFERELFAIWDVGVFHGMLIYSPPGVGKTTALRALAGHLGSGRLSKRVVVVDERCEFIDKDYRYAQVDILRGYKKRQGIEIATRTLSPEIIMVDEVGGDDAEALLRVIRCGVPVVATAHASDFEQLSSGTAISPLIDEGIFDTFVGIKVEDGRYLVSVDRIMYGNEKSALSYSPQTR